MFDAEFVDHLRGQFPALSRLHSDGRPVVYFDGPAGTQVPQRVIDRITHYLTHCNANHGGPFATSRESDELLAEAHQALADLLGADDPATICFGPNMTTLTFALSRALAQTWNAGDEILVTRLDHDGNVTPWVRAAEDRQVTVRYAGIHEADCTLDLDDLRSKINDRTRLVAVGCASNASGTINPVSDIVRWAAEAGALTFLDAVHYAPHAAVNVEQIGCDFLACSTYKFFGPHQGVLWGRRELLETLPAYKLRPAPDHLPDKWMTGTQNHEAIAGALGAVEYMADIGHRLGGTNLDRRAALNASYQAIGDYEQDLAEYFLDGLQAIGGFRVWGITDRARWKERLPTFSITHSDRTAGQLAEYLGNQGIFTWCGNYYALQLTETLGLEPEGMLRVGLVHYNTRDEVDRLLSALGEAIRGGGTF